MTYGQWTMCLEVESKKRIDKMCKKARLATIGLGRFQTVKLIPAATDQSKAFLVIAAA